MVPSDENPDERARPESDDDIDVPLPEEFSDDHDSRRIAEREWAALLEAKEFPDARQYSAQQTIIRREKLQDALHFGVRCFVRFAILPVIGFVGVWALHRLGPPDLRWLTPEEVDNLQTILFSGALSALVTLIGSRAFKN